MKKLSDLSLADLIALLNLFEKWGTNSWYDAVKKEIDKRIYEIDFK